MEFSRLRTYNREDTTQEHRDEHQFPWAPELCCRTTNQTSDRITPEVAGENVRLLLRSPIEGDHAGWL